MLTIVTLAGLEGTVAGLILAEPHLPLTVSVVSGCTITVSGKPSKSM